MSLPLILDCEKLKEDLFRLPKEALAMLFSQTETCISDYKLFKILEEKLLVLKTEKINDKKEPDLMKIFSTIQNEDIKEPIFPSDSTSD